MSTGQQGKIGSGSSFHLVKNLDLKFLQLSAAFSFPLQTRKGREIENYRSLLTEIWQLKNREGKTSILKRTS